MKKYLDYLVKPKLLIMYLMKHYGSWLNDEQFLKTYYRLKLGKKLDLENPKCLTEKINWLKLYDRNPLYHQLVDKYEVKSYVREKLGAEVVIPEYGVWDSFDEIDFSKLPDKFILKCTHASGGMAICNDKQTFDTNKAKKSLNRFMGREYYYSSREWAYKDVKPRIMAEALIESLGHEDSVEYKLTCYNGKVAFFTICTGIAHSDFEKRKNDHFDRNYNKLDWYAYYKPADKPVTIPKEMGKMIEYAETLAEGIPQVRVDFYLIDGNIFFGEMTFYTWAGFIEFTPPIWDEKLGSWLQLPEKK